MLWNHLTVNKVLSLSGKKLKFLAWTKHAPVSPERSLCFLLSSYRTQYDIDTTNRHIKEKKTVRTLKNLCVTLLVGIYNRNELWIKEWWLQTNELLWCYVVARNEWGKMYFFCWSSIFVWYGLETQEICYQHIFDKTYFRLLKFFIWFFYWNK